MNRNIIYGIIFCLLINSCTSGSKEVARKSSNDTTKVIESVIRSVFDSNSLPGIYSLRKSYRFKDSILFTSDSISLNYLPIQVDSFKFKVLPLSQVISLLKSDSGKLPIPNYLRLWAFQKKDSCFEVLIASHSIVDYCGGGIFTLELRKSNDSFIVYHRSGSSIN